MAQPDVLKEKGEKVVLLGNEAIVRGALEAGVGFMATYPGTPSSEVGLTAARIAKTAGFYYEWSTNEKVALEAAAGAAFSGVKSMTAMKHFGLNVACDSLLPIIYTGVKNSFVIMVADDPGGHSSAQTEEDSRYFSRLGYIPTIEPSSVQECKDFTKLAFEISEKYEIPVMLRTTTKVNHGTANLTLGEIKPPQTTGKFEKDPERYNNIKQGLFDLHQKTIDKIKQIEEDYSNFNTTEGTGKIGILTHGVSYLHLKEVGTEINLTNIKLGKLNFTYPISKKFVTEFIKDLDKIIVVEELDPIIENEVRQIAKDINPNLIIHGKDILPQVNEFTPDLILDKISTILNLELEKPKTTTETNLELPARKPVLCSGCPHASTLYALKKVLGTEVVWAGDIGCYMLGVFKPWETADFLIAMGAGVGLAHGISKVSEQKVISLIGDSTFFHAGIPAIVNMKINGSKGLVVILNNDTTAMTGHQPIPAGCRTPVCDAIDDIKIENVVKSFGISNVKVANAFNQKELQKAIQELTEKDELGVLISQGECRLLTKRKLRKEGKKFLTYQIYPNKKEEAMAALQGFACPAIIDGKINQDLCWGCTICLQLCPPGTIAINKEANHESSENNKSVGAGEK